MIFIIPVYVGYWVYNKLGASKDKEHENRNKWLGVLAGVGIVIVTVGAVALMTARGAPIITVMAAGGALSIAVFGYAMVINRHHKQFKETKVFKEEFNLNDDEESSDTDSDKDSNINIRSKDSNLSIRSKDSNISIRSKDSNISIRSKDSNINIHSKESNVLLKYTIPNMDNRRIIKMKRLTTRKE